MSAANEARQSAGTEAAFLAAVQAYSDHGVQQWHTPGHKQGRGASQELRNLMGQALASDLSDVLHDPGTDHSWDRLLRQAEERAAMVWGAEWTRFLVNGTSGGIHAMLLAHLSEGERVIVPRESHLSVVGGLVLSGAQPHYLPMRISPTLGLPLPPGPSDYAAALTQCPEARAVLVTYPNYYGLCPDLTGIVAVAGAHGARVLVDEAHGAHYAFHPDFPASALSCGADVAVQSAHKTLGALTQASMIHAAGGVDFAALDRALVWVGTTSPSSLLLASLDAARVQMQIDGRKLWGRALQVAEEARSRLAQQPDVVCLGASELDGLVAAWDRTRLLIGCSNMGGLELAAALRRDHSVQVEMADYRYAVVLVGLGDDTAQVERLVQAVRAVASGPSVVGPRSLAVPALPPIRLTPRESGRRRAERIPWRRAVGRISAQLLCPYPPGVPVIAPGEEITANLVAYVEEAEALGVGFRGDQGDGQVAVVVS